MYVPVSSYASQKVSLSYFLYDRKKRLLRKSVPRLLRNSLLCALDRRVLLQIPQYLHSRAALGPQLPRHTLQKMSASVSQKRNARLPRRRTNSRRRIIHTWYPPPPTFSRLTNQLMISQSAPPSRGKSRSAEPAPQGAGLKMAAHPLLLDTSTPAPQSKKDRYKPMQPKFASIRANARNVPTPPPAPPPPQTVAKENPYAAAAASASAETGFEGTPRERVGRSLRFNPKGKYVSIANQMRQDSQLEALKQRIAESARKAGLDSEFDTLEKNIRVRQCVNDLVAC